MTNHQYSLVVFYCLKTEQTKGERRWNSKKRADSVKLFSGLSWEETALMMGRKCTAGSVKMEFQRFMKES